MRPDFEHVTSDRDLKRVLEFLPSGGVVGVDTESDSFFHYRERVCLIQMTGGGRDVVIDPLAIDDLSPLGPLMADPSVVKVFHGADYDISSLKRDYGFTIEPIFDTMLAAQALGYDGISLADLVERFFSVKLDKRYQRRDWSRRPLPDEQLDYARLDSHFLPRLRELLSREIEEAGREKQVAEECRILEQREWVDHTFKPDDFIRIRGVGKLDDRARRILRSLCVVRDDLARRQDRPHFKVIGNEVLLKIARRAPETRQELVEHLGAKHHVVRRYSDRVIEAVRRGLKDREPLPRSRPDSRGGRRLSGPVEKRLYASLRTWRNQLAEERGVSSGVLINNAQLQEIAVLRPSSVDDLDKLPDLRQWQRDEFGPEIVAIVAKAS